MNNVWTEHCATLRQQIETLTAEREQYKVAWQKAEIEVHDLTEQLRKTSEALKCWQIAFTKEPRTAGEQTKEKEL